MKNYELKNHLEELVTSNPYNPITFYGGVVCRLNRWLVTAALGARNRFDPSVIYNPEGKILSSKEIESMETEELEKNWRFYISDDSTSFYGRNSPEKLFTNTDDRSKEKYIYCLSNVYCEESQELLIHIATMLPMPIKLWINGELLFLGTIDYFKKNHIFSAKFKEGNNTILIEKPMCANNRRLSLTPKYFSVAIRHIDTVTKSKLAIKINQNNQISNYLNKFILIPNKLFYDDGDIIRVVVFRNRQHYDENKQLNLKITASNNQVVIHKIITTNTIEEFIIKVELNCTLKIEVDDSEGVTENKYIFYGDFESYKEKLSSLLPGVINDEQYDDLMSSINLLDKNKGFIKNTLEPIHEYYAKIVLSKCYISQNIIFDKNGVEYFYLGESLKFYKSDIDGEKITYFQYVPKEYNPMKRYSLFVYFIFDDIGTRISLNPFRTICNLDDEYIIISFCSKSEYYKDYIYDYEFYQILSNIIKTYSIDMDKIYFHGICVGGKRGYKLLQRKPDFFASMLSFASTATESGFIKTKTKLLNNISNIEITQICLTDDIIFNGATILNDSKIINANTYIEFDFEHEEFIDYYCNSGLTTISSLLEKNRYPEHVMYCTEKEPQYKKAFWMEIDKIEDMSVPVDINAKIVKPYELRVDFTNISKISLNLAKNEMNLENTINIYLNGIKYTVELGEYSIIQIEKCNENEFVLQSKNITYEEHVEKYNQLNTDKKCYGIKGIYLDKCFIVKNMEEDDFERNLLILLSQPIKSRIRNYIYEIVNELDIASCRVEGNYILTIDVEKMNDLKEEFLASINIKIKNRETYLKNNILSGNYFIMVKDINPFHSAKDILVIIYNGQTAKEELIRLMEDFENNPFLFYNVIVFNNGNYLYS